MKKYYQIICLLFCIPLFGACDSDKVWDFICPDVMIAVCDGENNDLLDPSFEGNILANEIIIDYKGDKYTFEAPETKDNAPLWEGARVEYSEYYECWILRFGEFSPTAGYRKEPFTIDWGDGTRDEAAFDLYITWSRGDPNVHQRTYLNGETNSYSSMLLKVVK